MKSPIRSVSYIPLAILGSIICAGCGASQMSPAAEASQSALVAEAMGTSSEVVTASPTPTAFNFGATAGADGIGVQVSELHSYQESDVASGGYAGANVVVLQFAISNATQSLYDPTLTDITVTDTTIGESADQVVDTTSSAPDIGFESQVAPSAAEVIVTGWAVDAEDQVRVDVQFPDPTGGNLNGTWTGVAA